MNISNMKDWCIALNEQSANVKIYEDKLDDFFNYSKDKTIYDSSMMTGCYKKRKFGSIVPAVIFSKFGVKFIISAILGLILSVFPIMDMKGPVLERITENLTPLLTRFGVGVLVGLIVTSAIHVLFYKLKFDSKVKTLAKLEASLIPLMKTVPSNYRNSDKMNAIARMYFTRPTIDPSIVLECVDDFLTQYPNYSRYPAVMFDLPCNCPFLQVNDSQNANANIKIDENGNIEQRNEFLPSDIDSKVMSGSQDSDKDLNAMIGLSGVKDQIQRLKNRMSFYGKDAANNGNHMAFLGSAGTGKTTVARIVTKMLFDLGYIKKNQYIEISGDYLCAGSTSRASAIIEYSYDGVLFIDEAYLMYRTGSEVIGVLLKAMEDHREDFVVILAGYEEQMTKLFASNEGFTSRIKHNIYFTDYDENEMLDIFNYFISNYNNKRYTLDNLAIPLLLDAFRLEKKAKSFGNARTVRNAVDMIMDFYADRSINEKTDTKIIKLEDIEPYYNNRKVFLQHEIKNASAADQLDEQIIRLSELKPRVKAGSENPEGDLSELVGLDSFKLEMDALKNQKEFYGKVDSQNILLVGGLGCGKSTLTKILTGYLYKLGFIEENKFLDIPAELLKGSYVGHTAKRAEAIISYASGGVLYIRNYNTLAEGNDAFAGEALNAIASALNENQNVTIVIGDSDSDYIDSIRNLFSIVYELPEYTEEQILEIFNLLARKENFIVEEAAAQKVLDYISKNNSGIKDIQQIFANSVKTHVRNFDGNEENKFLLSEADITFPIKKIKLNIGK